MLPMFLSSYLTHDPVLSPSSNTYRAAPRELRSGNIDPGEFLWHPYDVYGAGSFPISVCMLSTDDKITTIFGCRNTHMTLYCSNIIKCLQNLAKGVETW